MANTNRKQIGGRSKIHPAATTPPKPATRLGGDVEEVAARYPRLGRVETEALAGLCSDARADDLGGRTRAPAVRDAAADWMVTMDKALTRYPGALAGYASG